IKAIYKADLTGIADPTKPGEELLIIRAGSSGGPSYEQTTAPAPSADISAFQVLPVTVTDPVCAVDSNNSLAEAVEIGLGNQATDILCFTDDEEDWYYFDIPVGLIAEGQINCFMDAMIWGMELFDQFGQYIGPSTQVTVNQHIFDLDKLDLDPGRYYIRTYVVFFTVAGPGTLIYLLEADATLTDVTPVSPVDVTPPWLDLEVKWMAKHENYVFLTGQAGIWVYDISDTTSPAYVARIPDLVLPEPTFNYPYLYYWEIPTDNPAGLDLVDFTDPNNPVHHEDVLVIPGIIQSITMNSETLYVATDTGGDKKIIFYDIIPDPSSPELITEFIAPKIKERMDLIDPEGNHTALIYSTSGTITAYEVENPYSPVNKGQITLFSGYYTDFAIEGLYILNSWVDTMNQGAVSVFSYSNITGLNNEGDVYVPGDALYLDAAGTTAYVGDGSQGLAVVDYSNPATPVLVISKNTVSDSHYVYADGEVLLNIPEHAGFSVYDLSIPLNPVETARVPCLNYPVDGVAGGDYAYFIESKNSHGALVTVNISDPSNAWIVMESQLGFNPSSISMDGNKLAVGGSSSGDLNIFWLGYYDFPALVADYALAVSITSVLVHGDYCYAALANGSFEIFDLSAIPAVTQLPLVLHPPMLYDLVAGDGYMYGYDGANVKIFDISIPSIPAFTGSYTKPEDIRELAIRHNILYIISTGTLYAENISVGSAPANVGSLVLPWPPNMRYMALDHHFAYLSDNTHATNAVSLWPPGSLSIYGEIGSWPGYMNRGLLAHDGALYEMHALTGLRIYDLY
ncbi:hypothetical protein KAU08_03215, partial [bacterium]|nr:hypothetical protein [bacterium]